MVEAYAVNTARLNDLEKRLDAVDTVTTDVNKLTQVAQELQVNMNKNVIQI